MGVGVQSVGFKYQVSGSRGESQHVGGDKFSEYGRSDIVGLEDRVRGFGVLSLH